MAPGMSLASVNAIIILSTDDASRIFAKYYTAPHHAAPGAGQAASATAPPNPYADVKAQKSFEKGLLEKTAKQTGDIILYDNRIVLYKMESDVMMYVVGGVDENEVLLYNVILALRDSLHLLFNRSTSAPSSRTTTWSRSPSTRSSTTASSSRRTRPSSSRGSARRRPRTRST
ncbi:hypothetical protein RB599_008355 [Gaeumannomyces hyphopodioides]